MSEPTYSYGFFATNAGERSLTNITELNPKMEPEHFRRLHKELQVLAPGEQITSIDVKKMDGSPSYINARLQNGDSIEIRHGNDGRHQIARLSPQEQHLWTMHNNTANKGWIGGFGHANHADDFPKHMVKNAEMVADKVREHAIHFQPLRRHAKSAVHTGRKYNSLVGPVLAGVSTLLGMAGFSRAEAETSDAASVLGGAHPTHDSVAGKIADKIYDTGNCLAGINTHKCKKPSPDNKPTSNWPQPPMSQ